MAVSPCLTVRVDGDYAMLKSKPPPTTTDTLAVLSSGPGVGDPAGLARIGIWYVPGAFAESTVTVILEVKGAGTLFTVKLTEIPRVGGVDQSMIVGFPGIVPET